MDAMYSDNESDNKPMSTETLKDICDGSQSNPNVNRRESCYKIRDRIKQSQSEWKGALKPTQIMGKNSCKVFKTVVKEIFPSFTTFWRI